MKTTASADRPRVAHQRADPVSPALWRGSDDAFTTLPGALRMQPKLEVGAPDDRSEKEAEHMADTVMRMPHPAEAIQRQTDAEEEEAMLQARAAPGRTPSAQPETEQSIEQLQGRGAPLPAKAREFLEPRFGADFSSVRVHHDGPSATLARSVGARAFTVGHDVVFGPGEFAPESRSGQHLLAHELTHVIQQDSRGSLHSESESTVETRSTATAGVDLSTQAIAQPSSIKVSRADTSIQRYVPDRFPNNMSEDAARALIDGALGSGWFDTWMTFENEASTELNRARVNRARFDKNNTSSNYDRLYWDNDRVERAAFDFREQMLNILKGVSVDQDRVDDLNAVYSLALGVLELDNDALDGVFALGVASAFVVVPWVLILSATRALEKHLSRLKKLLEKAEEEETESWIKGIIAGAVTAATLLLPQVSVVARLTMAVGQVGLDFILEGPDQSTVKEVGSKAGPIAEQVADGIADIEKMGPGTKAAAKGTSRSISAAGLYFNISEIQTARSNVAELEAQIKKAEKAHHHFLTVLAKNKRNYLLFIIKFSKAQQRIGEVWENARETRSVLNEEMKESGYHP